MERRVQCLQASVGPCLIENPTDLAYLTGLALSRGLLILTDEQAQLFVDARYSQMAQERCALSVAPLNDEKVLAHLKKTHPRTLLFDSRYTNYARYVQLRALAKQASVQLKPRASILKQLRAIKEDGEIGKLRRSAQCLKREHASLAKKLRTGVTEVQLARAFELHALAHGAEGLAFAPIVAFGKNSAMPHYHPGNASYQRGQSALLDLGLVQEGYHSDMTRTLHIENRTLQRAEHIVRQAHAAALCLCKPGVRVKELDLAVRRVFATEGLEKHFLHSLGHGIGLETHEFPLVSSRGEDAEVVLVAGMVLAIEPGLYFPNVGGVRHEDMILITPDGHENLTA